MALLSLILLKVQTAPTKQVQFRSAPLQSIHSSNSVAKFQLFRESCSGFHHIRGLGSRKSDLYSVPEAMNNTCEY